MEKLGRFGDRVWAFHRSASEQDNVTAVTAPRAGFAYIRRIRLTMI
jgi:hypothetical protein